MTNPITKDTPDFEAVLHNAVYNGLNRLTGDKLLAAHNQAVEAALLPFANAVNNKGSNPRYHDEQMERLRMDWPVLYHLLAQLQPIRKVVSNYLRWTKKPDTGEFEQAEWLDDFYGRHMYGVRFASTGQTFPESDYPWEFDDDREIELPEALPNGTTNPSPTTTDANLTSDNQPTQSFDDKLETILQLHVSGMKIYEENGKFEVYVKELGRSIKRIKAAVVEARPDGVMINASDGFAALDEWSKNLNLETNNGSN